MKIKFLVAILMFVVGVLFSFCQENKTAEYKQKIVGEWFSVGEECILDTTLLKNADLNLLPPPPPPPPPPYSFKAGYTFYTNDTVDVKCGIYKHFSGEYRNKFLRNKTPYEIEAGFLKIYGLNMLDSSWNYKKIIKLTDDSLFLKRDFENYGQYFYLEKYAKFKGNLDTTIDFDEILINGSYSGGPKGWSLVYKLSKRGYILFNTHQMDTSHLGFFKTKISNEKFIEIANNFRKIDLQSLHNVNDFDEDVYNERMSFWKDGKLVKSIEYQKEGVPSELICAKNQLMNLRHLLSFSKIDSSQVEQLLNTEQKYFFGYSMPMPQHPHYKAQ